MNSSNAHVSDIELYAALKNGKSVSEPAFAELYARHSPRIFAYCRRILGDRESAQDAFQETFIRFYNSAQQNREMTNVPAYLLRIARNICLNMQRNNHNNKFRRLSFTLYRRIFARKKRVALFSYYCSRIIT